MGVITIHFLRRFMDFYESEIVKVTDRTITNVNKEMSETDSFGLYYMSKELYGYMPSEKLKATKEYKELSNFVKTAKLRENLALLKINSLALKDNKKTKMKAAKDKKTKAMVAKAFDMMIEKVEKKIEAKENEIAKRCGETK